MTKNIGISSFGSKVIKTGLFLYLLIVGAILLRILHYTEDSSKATRNMPILQDMLSGLLDAESGQRGYLYSMDSKYLTQYHRGTGQATYNLILLNEFLDSDLERPKVKELIRTANSKLKEMDMTVEFVSSGNFGAAKEIFGTGNGQRDMERIKTLCEVLKAQELNRQFKATIF